MLNRGIPNTGAQVPDREHWSRSLYAHYTIYAVLYMADIRTKRQTTIHKKLFRKLKIEQHEFLKNSGEFMLSWSVSSSCSSSGTRRATLQWQVINEERTISWMQQIEHIHGHLWHRYSVTGKTKIKILFVSPIPTLAINPGVGR